RCCLFGGNRCDRRHAQERGALLHRCALPGEVPIGKNHRAVRLLALPRLSRGRHCAEQHDANDENVNSECPSPLEGEGQGEGEIKRPLVRSLSKDTVCALKKKLTHKARLLAICSA